MSQLSEQPATNGDTPSGRRRRRTTAAGEAQIALVAPIANWQARYAWASASWGLLPVVGLPLGIAAVVLGLFGWRRVRRRPDDLGVRHAIGGIIVGTLEIITNSAGIACVVQGVRELTR